MVHRLNIFLLSIILALAPAYLYASSPLGGWTITSQVAQGASTIINATKNAVINGANVLKTSSAKITPNAAQVSKVLARGLAGYALSVAVQQLLGSVDWVLDPVNNRIKWKEAGTSAGTYIFLCTEHTNGCPTSSTMIHPTLKNPNLPFQFRDVCQSYASSLGGSMHSNTSSGTCIVTVGGQNKFYGIGTRIIEGSDAQEKSIPLDVVSQQVISNAESGDSNAQVATTAAAADIIADAQTDTTKARPITNQLETNAKTQTAEEAQAETKPKDPTKPEQGYNIKLNFPVFCGWAPIVCEAAQVVISFPQTLTDWWDASTKSITDAWTWSKDQYKDVTKSITDSWTWLKDKVNASIASVSDAWTWTKDQYKQVTKSITDAWVFTKDWMSNEDTPNKTTEVEIDQTIPVVPNTSYFNWGAYCPFTPGSQTISLENTSAPIDYDLTSWCDMATDIRPFVLAAGALMSFLIAAGIVMGRDD